MKKECKLQLQHVISELSYFLYKDFSSQFKNLTEKEDRQLFFLAKVLVQLKQILNEPESDEKVVPFQRSKNPQLIKE